MSTTMTAASKLRDICLALEGVILITAAGHPDKILRVLPLDKRFKDTHGKKDSQGKYVEPCLVLSLDNGPQAEAWREIERDIFIRSRRDRAIPSPVPVAPSSKEEWSINPEDIPVVTLIPEAQEIAETPIVNQVKVAEAKIESEASVTLCPEGCGKSFKAAGLKGHITTKHKKK